MDDKAIELEALDLERVCSDASAEPIRLSYGLLRSVTKNFSNEIGRGGFGAVYMGCLLHGRVAVKKLFSAQGISDKQFLDEILCLKKAKHRNIVRLLGYCSEIQGEVMEYNGDHVMADIQKRLLCFEYVPNGNIQHYLEEKPKGDEWKIRYQIIKGICQGLQYLHKERISHLDLKPENVMLDACMEPKITDFGLSRCLVEGQSKVYTTTIRGTLGYIAPEVINTGEISLKSDIYALGIIIIRLLTGCNDIDLGKWKCCQDSLLDMDSRQVRHCAKIADRCTRTNQDRRPTIGDIICRLEEMESMLQESTNDTGSSTNQVSRMASPSTELLDVYPLELSFPFQTKQQHESHCQVSLINKTDGEVGFFVIPNLGGRIMPVNGILMPMSTSVFTLTRLMSRKGEPPLGSCDKVLILMFVMRSSDDVRQLMKTSVDEDGELNMPTDDLYKQVQQLGGEIHRTMLTAAVQHDTRTPRARFRCSTCISGSNRIRSVDAHPTEPWILVSYMIDVYIWNWQTKQKINLKIKYARSVKFIARKQWLVIGKGQSIHVYTCPTLDQINKVMQLRVQDSESSSCCYTKLAVHPSRPFVMSYGQDTNSVASMRLWNWEQNWSCTRIFDVTSLVLQVRFNTKDTKTFATLHEQDEGVNSVKIWNFGCSTPIATMPEGMEGTKLGSVFTRGADQHLITAIRGSCAKIGDLHKGVRVHTLWIHGGSHFSDEIEAVACHPKHPVLVTGSFRSIRVWDCNTYRLKKEYVSNEWRRLQDLKFLESGRLVVICDKRVGILDIDVD